METEFHGSYAAGDVRFLLRPMALEPISNVIEKERLIQSGIRHYGEMLSPENLPTPAYMALFHAAVEANAERMASDLVCLARHIRAARDGAITLVSLARAGTPVGVMLRRLLAVLFGVDAPHYSISVIRDRGADANALDYVLAHHDVKSLVFVDGWTAKGTIRAELRRTLAVYGAARGIALDPDLFVLSDLAGQAYACGSTEDYLIPSALLNATISGLVSRTVLNVQSGSEQFHGCLYYGDVGDWMAHDLSTWFIDRLFSEVSRHQACWMALALPEVDRVAQQHFMQRLIQTISASYMVNDPNFIKPGIGEATRALLRRAPRLLLLRDATAPETRHLVQLAHERAVSIEIDAALPLHAVALIRRLADA
jgi:hypothetical protein